ncbi:MFS transporter [Candidatus Nomurabacteria bacterium]|nr:MFS transporter [Candidatus Nomurabacteria bacterium]
MNKRKLFLWSLYDFANSIVFINFLLYFAQWIVIDGGLSDFWYNAIFAIATVLLFLSAPILAAYTDRHGGRKFFLNISTVGTFISYGMAALLASIGGANIFVVALLFLLGQYFYQLSFVFYNPMLAEIADKEHRSRASGIGQLANACGQAVGILITLPFVYSRTAPLLPAVGVFFALALPMMIFFKEDKLRERKVSMQTIKSETADFRKKAMAFFAASIATPVLVAFFFFNDALITISNNYSIYMERVFAVPDMTKSILLLAIIVMSAVGGVVAGWLGDRIGLLKTLKIILFGWVITLPIIALAPNIIVFSIATIIVGLLLGSVFSTTRAYVSTLLSEEEMGYGFSFYTICERFATFVGPLTWGSMIGLMGTASSSYRIVMGTMNVFIILGFIILVIWKKKPKVIIA